MTKSEFGKLEEGSVATSSSTEASSGKAAEGGAGGATGEVHADGALKTKGDGKSTISGAVFNLANAVIGAGVGGMPYALKRAGFFCGIMLICVVAMCSDYSLRLLVTLSRRTHSKYYEDLVSSQFGHSGYLFVVGAMGIFAYGAMVAYLMGIGDNMAIVVAHASGVHLKTNMWLKRVTLVAIAVGAVLPLSLLKNMAKLSKTSFVSICAVVVILCIVITRAFTGPGDAPAPTTDAERELKFIDTGFFPAIGVIAFAFVCHHACFIVFNTLRDNTEERWAKTVHCTLGVATSVMLLLSIAAFLTFRSLMTGSFLTNYSYTDPLCNFMRCLFAIAQTLTYPLELFVSRHAIHAIMFPAQRWTDAQHYTITALLWGSSLAIALNVADLGAVLELTGGVAAVSIGFLVPPVLHFKMTPELNWVPWRNKPSKRWLACKTFAADYFLFVIGSLAMFFTITTMLAELGGEHGGPHDSFDPNFESGGVDEYGNPLPGYDAAADALANAAARAGGGSGGH